MAENEVTSGVDLHLDLTPSGSRRAALATALRDAVTSGRLEPGTALPSYRALARDLTIARNTVAETYAELVSEGWLEAKQGCGTRVAHRARAVASDISIPRPEMRPMYDFRPGRPDPGGFPRSAWLTAAKRAVNAAPVEAFGPGDPHGRIELRRALSDYLARTRGVVADPRRIVVCSGFSQAAQLITRVGSTFALEAYGLPFHRAIFEESGPTDCVPVDDNGCCTDRLDRTDARTLVLTPSHQFPTGSPLHPTRRTAAVRWARDRDGLVVEDDYDGEFRYDRTPVGAMHSLDPDRVLYVGSASKSLSPGIRVGWMVVPEHLLDAILALKGVREATVGVVDQLTLAEMITSGSYDRHVRATRLKYRRRRDQLLDAVTRRVPHVGVMGISAGLQAVLTLPAGTEEVILERAGDAGIALEGLHWFRHPDAEDDIGDGVLAGFPAPSNSSYAAAVDALVSILALTAPGRTRG